MARVVRVERAPSVAEGAESLSYLSNLLAKELEQDLAADEAGIIQSADIDLEPLQVPPVRDVITARVDAALRYWDELSHRIPLKRPASRTSGRRAGSTQTYVDFDIAAADVPTTPPSFTDDLETYRYYLKRLLCSVPRAEQMRGWNAAPNLRMFEVQQMLDTERNKTPHGDGHLLREINYLFLDAESKSPRNMPPNSATHPAEGSVAPDDVQARAAVGVDNDQVEAKRSGVPTAQDARNTDLVAGHPVPTMEGRQDGSCSGLNNSLASGIGDTVARQGSGSSTIPTEAFSNAGSQTDALKEKTANSIVDGSSSAFLGPCRVVVTFVFCRSATTSGNGAPVEKRLFEVEALEEHTLQQVMEAIPPCLSDRIVDGHNQEKNAGAMGPGNGEAPSVRPRKCLTLRGAFIFARGTFYALRAAEGQDDPPEPVYPVPPGSVEKLEAALATRRREREKWFKELKARAKLKRKGSGSRPDPKFGIGWKTDSEPQSLAAHALPLPWMQRWLADGGKRWHVVMRQLMDYATEFEEMKRTAAEEEKKAAEEEIALIEAAYPTPGGSGAGGAGRKRGRPAGGGSAGIGGGRGGTFTTGGSGIKETDASIGAADRRKGRARSQTVEDDSESDGHFSVEDDDSSGGEDDVILSEEDGSRAASEREDGVDGPHGASNGRSNGKGKKRATGEGVTRIRASQKNGQDRSRERSQAADYHDDEGGGLYEGGSDADADNEQPNVGASGENTAGPRKVRSNTTTRKRGETVATNGSGSSSSSSSSSKGSGKKRARERAPSATDKTKRRRKSREGDSEISDGHGDGSSSDGSSSSGFSSRPDNDDKGGGYENPKMVKMTDVERRKYRARLAKNRVAGTTVSRNSAKGAAAKGEAKKEDAGKPALPYNQGTNIRGKLGMDDGGKVVWASDVMVADFRPALGQRYMFVHHGDCEHHFIVSDVRLEPVPSASHASSTSSTTVNRSHGLNSIGSNSTDEAQPSAAVDQSGSNSVNRRSNSINQLSSGSADDGVIPRTEEVGNTQDRGEGALENDDIKREDEKVHVYPRPVFRGKSNIKRCSICCARVAAYKSFGHPLADEVPLHGCEMCFRMLHYDATGNLLTGEAAGIRGTTDVRDGSATAVGASASAGEGAGGLAGWRVFPCFDEI